MDSLNSVEIPGSDHKSGLLANRLGLDYCIFYSNIIMCNYCVIIVQITVY